MPTDVFLAGLCGALCICTAICVFTHEILLSPDRPNYPSARGYLRILMFAWSGALIYRGVEFLSGIGNAEAPVVTAGSVLVWGVAFVVHAALLENHMRMWLPARIQAKFKAMREIVTCARLRKLQEARNSSLDAVRPGVAIAGVPDVFMAGAAMADLQVEGTRVIPPDAPKGAVH